MFETATTSATVSPSARAFSSTPAAASTAATSFFARPGNRACRSTAAAVLRRCEKSAAANALSRL